jgi:beta-lactamase class A
MRELPFLSRGFVTTRDVDRRVLVDRWKMAANRFAGDDPGRSIALASFDGAIEPIVIRGDVARPGGSVLKLPLVAAVFAAAASGDIVLSDRIRVGRLQASKWPSVSDAFPESIDISLFEMCALSIVASDNPCADFLSRFVGFDRVNRWMRSIGLSDRSSFGSGYADADIEGSGRDNRVTAHDCVLLFKEIFANDSFVLLRRFLYNNIRNQRIPRLLGDDTPVAHKTGSLDGVVNDAGVITCQSMAFIAVFLSEDQRNPLRTESEIGETARSCLDAAFAARGR